MRRGRPRSRSNVASHLGCSLNYHMWPGIAIVLGAGQPNKTTPCESDAAADDAFVEAVRSSPGPIGCRPGGFERIDKLARLLSAAGSGGCSQFGFHGMFGVFSEPLKSSPGWISKYKYGSTKSSFIFNETCAHAHASPCELLQICEIGFNAGHTALLFLEAAPAARVLSFDLGDMPWAKKQAVARMVRPASRLSLAPVMRRCRLIRAACQKRHPSAMLRSAMAGRRRA